MLQLTTDYNDVYVYIYIIYVFIYMIRVQIFINPGVVAFTAYDLLNCSTEKIYSNCLKICSLYFIR